MAVSPKFIARRLRSSSAKPPPSTQSSHCTHDDFAISSPSARSSRPKRIVVGITGATGTLFAIRLLEMLRDQGVETHLVMSKWAMATGKYETALTESDILQLATHAYTAKNLSAPIASGSFVHDGMMVVPCSMKTLAAIRTGFCDDLISRAADVSLKEGRRLLLAVRETPLSDIHLDNMLFLRRAGAVIFPPVPAFYTAPKSLDDIITQSAGRMLDSFGIYTSNFKRWNGFDWDSKRP
ncbi:related to PAD1 - phenylacrylic acid decarboxylase [Cephalotrichum gorgonifer]|uniref:Flavin prenyltransferase PAD1, mitochondrial n=1 Tax=Cephalotrichum gorgonifer TaxID=2041049 RepID=A0AAE8N4I3_9PEZI|nr:related to PAD1 - phenylacrylic acid decarboxylase [Cephalotrichum gorgonifer]